MRREDLQTPTLLIDLAAVRHNLDTMRRFVGGDLRRWRPHVKTCKVPEVLGLLLQAGVRRFKCATTREAEVLLRLAGPLPIDLLVAMAHRGANLQRIAALQRAAPQHRFAMLSEEREHARELADLGLGVFVDLDPGYHRTGIPLAARDRILDVVGGAGPALRGLHYYDGHLHHGTLAERTAAATALYDDLATFAAPWHREPAFELITSGTPTFPIALAHDGLRAFDHTVSPGTVVYWDWRSAQLGIDGFRCAVTVQARVISRPIDGRITVDAGSKALDAAVPDPVAVAQGPWRLRALRPSEEHLPMQVEDGHAPPLGTLLQLVPMHVCPTVNLADDAALLEDDRVVAIVPVRARGHETLPAGPGSSVPGCAVPGSR